MSIYSLKSPEQEKDKGCSSAQHSAVMTQSVTDDFRTKALNCLEDGSAMSSKFSSELEEYYNELKIKEQKHMANFSDESSDSDDEDDDLQETVDLSLRKYQEELSQNALAGKNTIICAPTGSGKTRVATYVILEHLKKKEDGRLKKKIAFLARTVPLVMQQFKSLKKYLPSKYQDKMESVTGDSEYSMSLHKLLDEYDVFVMTPRILENHVQGEKPLIPGGLAAFSLLVFDECHHTREGEAYNTLMLSYLNTKKESPHDLPQIVGLTASIGIEKAKDVEEAEENILKICSNLDAVSISTVKENEKEMRDLVPVPKDEKHKLKERPPDETVQKIEEIIKKLEKNAAHHINEVKNEELENLIKKIPQDRKSQQYGQWVVTVEKKAMAIARQPQNETNSSIHSIQAIAEHLKAYNVALELYDLVSWRYVLEFLQKRFSHFQERRSSLTRAEGTFYSFFHELERLERDTKKSNKNLKLLKRVIKENLESLDEEEAQHKHRKVSKGIIFVRTRFIAYALTSWMERNNDGHLKGLGTSVFTGTEASEDEGGMTSTQQEEIIERFQCGDLRLLVATSVAEEGLDIPECNLVIKYNHVGNEVTTVQMRGRSRSKGGKSVLLAFDSIYLKEFINQHDAEMMEKAIRNVSAMKEDDIRKNNDKNQEKILKEVEIEKIVKQNAKGDLEDIDFKLVCKKCRHNVINSQDIKLIDDSHHIVVNRPDDNLWHGFLQIYLPDQKADSNDISTGTESIMSESKTETDLGETDLRKPQILEIQQVPPDAKIQAYYPQKESEASGNQRTSTSQEGSITQAKTVAESSQPTARLITAVKDSGFPSASENINPASGESTTHPKVAPANSGTPTQQENNEVVAARTENLPDLIDQILAVAQHDHHLTEALPPSFIAFHALSEHLSQISSFIPPPKLAPVAIETPESSIPPAQFSPESSEDES
ncbi:interferon-induced helicase C domain-containing protein 1 [Elysia marginata]|uniref:Interferon-induced helicase C domain-containing protein 1 n=1 Tax=Elysia marginata TaxID=1093978 RepID=A0AAV4GLY5_9GAST|nr:interferon-induced helicase C domain-containing protein 1 [Elysia marginata]